MNAPFKSPTAGTRDAFSAYVCDDDTLDLLLPVANELGWPAEKCYKGGLRNAIQQLSVAASPNILLVDLSESGDPLNDINALAEVCEPGTVVIAMGQVNDVRLYRDLLASGIHDYILKPFGSEQIRETLVNAQAFFSAPRHAADDDEARLHLLTAVIGTRGGVGASTIATSLAWMISEGLKRPTALLDLDVHFGTGALALDLEPGRGLTDAIDNPSRIDGLFIERAMVRANENLALLSAEAPIHQPIMTDGSAFHLLQEELRNAFDVTVLDLPRHMLVQYPHLVHDVGVTVVVTELTLAAARDLIRIKSFLKQNAPDTRLVVVANKVVSGTGEIGRKDFEETIEGPIDFLIAYDPKMISQAAKLGRAYGDIVRGTKSGQPLDRLVQHIVAASEDIENAPKAKGKSSLLGKFDLKAMLSKSTAKN
ncbi:MAG: pilus assembly protein CpaE [Sphingomonadales bacterium]|nr:pilus assembly protein CpaE [Sphingomonadales bacterium]